MQETTKALNLLYVGKRPADSAAIRDQLGYKHDTAALSVASTADEVYERLATEQIDCILLDAGVDHQRWLDTIDRLTKQPCPPLIVFAGDHGGQFVEKAFTSGASDVIQSAVSETPRSLIRGRIEAAVQAESNRQIHQDILERYEKIYNTAADAIYQLDAEGRILAVNDAAVELTGFSREELVGSHVETLLDEEYVRKGNQILRELRDTDEPGFRTLEIEIETQSGELVPAEVRIAVLHQGGELAGSVGVARDISERKKREQELQAERDLIERIHETSPVGVCVVDGDGTVVRANERAATILGFRKDELLGSIYQNNLGELMDADGNPVEYEEVPANRVFETAEPIYGWEGQLKPKDGPSRWVSVNASPLVDNGGVEQVVLAFEDITEQKEHERRLTDQRNELAQINHLNGIIRGVTEALLEATTREEIEQTVCQKLSQSRRYQFAIALQQTGNGELESSAWTQAGSRIAEEATPVSEQCLRSRALETQETQAVQQIPETDTSQRWERAVKQAAVESMAAIPVVYDGQKYGVITVYAAEPNAFSERELAVLDELGETVGHAIAALESREREVILTALYETTEDLLAAETAQEVTDIVVTAAAEVLEPIGVGIFLFDNDENLLRPAAATDELLDFYGESTVFGPGKSDSETWRSFATGEQKCFADITESERVANPETDARSTLLLPLGHHGVFVVAATERGTFDSQMRQLISLLATTTEATLDRVTGRADIRKRDRELAERAEEIEQFEEVLSCIRDINQLLVRAETRNEIEASICTRLSQMEPYIFAWIGTVPPETTTIEPQTWAGNENGYLDNISLSVEVDEPAAVAAMTGEPTTITNVTDHLQDESWAREAAKRDFQSAMAIPLIYGETSYGVLTVYANDPDTFEGVVQSVLLELGEIIAYSINSVETKRGILAERVTELELRIGAPETFLNRIAAVTDQQVSYREITPGVGETARVLFALSDPPVEEILALESEFITVESLTHIERGAEQLFRATLSGPTVGATVLECGGIPHEVVASAGETNVIVRVPQELDVRVFLDRVCAQYPDTELVSRRDIDHQTEARTHIRATFEEGLTERQREVLLTAYESGFFESPRQTTGAELAGLLDISQPTITHHLREAQRRLFAALFEEDTAG